MIHKPPIDDLAAKIGSKYALCVVASKRAEPRSYRTSKKQKTVICCRAGNLRRKIDRYGRLTTGSNR